MHLYGSARQGALSAGRIGEQRVQNLLVVPTGSELVCGSILRPRMFVQSAWRRSGSGVIPRLKRIIMQEQPDLVHLHSRRGADILGGLAARLTGIPAVLTRRVDNPEPRLLINLKYRLFDRVITISEGIRQVLLSQVFLPQSGLCAQCGGC